MFMFLFYPSEIFLVIAINKINDRKKILALGYKDKQKSLI